MKYVYLLRTRGDYYKIGIASKVSSRLISLQTANPEKIDLVCSRMVADAMEVESELHKFLVDHKTNGGSEWFRLSPEQVIDVCVLLHQKPEAKMLDQQLTVQQVLADSWQERKNIYEELRNISSTLKLDANEIRRLARRSMDEGEFEEASAPEPPRPKQELDSDTEQYTGQAMAIFSEAGRASTSLLQRRLGIGYSKAARIVDSLEAKGLIGPHDGAHPRKVLAA